MTLLPKPTILEAAQAIRPFLTELIPDLAQQIDRDLEALLTQELNQATKNQITERLRQQTPTREWTQRYLKGETPDITRSTTLPGNSPPIVSTHLYQCSECNKTLKSPQLGLIPKCPTHPAAQVTAITTN